MINWELMIKKNNKQKLSFDGLGDGWVGGDNLMKTLDVYFDNDTYTIYNIKWDVTLWKKMIETKNGELLDKKRQSEVQQ